MPAVLVAFLTLVVWMLVLGLALWLLVYIIGLIPGMPDPIKQVVISVLYIITAIIVLFLLISTVSTFLPVPGVAWPGLRR